MSYTTEVLADSPVGYWRLNETVGDAIDLGSGGHNGTYTATGSTRGSPGLVDDGNAAVLQLPDAVTPKASVSIGDFLDFPAFAPFSVEVWFSPLAVDGSARRLIDKCNGASVDGYRIYYNSTTLVFNRIVSSVQGSASLSITLKVGETHHVVGTYDGSNLRLYLNGLLRAGPTATATSLADNAFALLLGGVSTASSASNLHGTLDEVAIYDTALSDARIATHYRTGLGPWFHQHDWLVPKVSRPNQPISFTGAAQTQLIGKDQFFGAAGQPPANLDWPVPKGRRFPVSLRTWTWNLLQSTLAPVLPSPFFQTEWPNPVRARRPSIPYAFSIHRFTSLVPVTIDRMRRAEKTTTGAAHRVEKRP